VGRRRAGGIEGPVAGGLKSMAAAGVPGKSTPQAASAPAEAAPNRGSARLWKGLNPTATLHLRGPRGYTQGAPAADPHLCLECGALDASGASRNSRRAARACGDSHAPSTVHSTSMRTACGAGICDSTVGAETGAAWGQAQQGLVRVCQGPGRAWGPQGAPQWAPQRGVQWAPQRGVQVGSAAGAHLWGGPHLRDGPHPGALQLSALGILSQSPSLLADTATVLHLPASWLHRPLVPMQGSLQPSAVLNPIKGSEGSSSTGFGWLRVCSRGPTGAGGPDRLGSGPTAGSLQPEEGRVSCSRGAHAESRSA